MTENHIHKHAFVCNKNPKMKFVIPATGDRKKQTIQFANGVFYTDDQYVADYLRLCIAQNPDVGQIMRYTDLEKANEAAKRIREQGKLMGGAVKGAVNSEAIRKMRNQQYANRDAVIDALKSNPKAMDELNKQLGDDLVLTNQIVHVPKSVDPNQTFEGFEQIKPVVKESIMPKAPEAVKKPDASALRGLLAKTGMPKE